MTFAATPVTNEVDPEDFNEQALIGAVLVHPDAFHAVSDVVDADRFGRSQHAEIWRIIEASFKAGRFPRPDLIVAALPQDFTAAGLSARGYINACVANASTLTNAHAIAADVRDASDRRELVRIANYMINIATRCPINQNAVTIAAGVIGELDAILTARADRAVARMTLGEAAVAVVDRMTSTDNVGVKLGLHDLDNVTGGLQPGDLAVLAGRPGMGKSALATAFAVNVGRAGIPTLSFNLEMTAEDVARRAIAGACYDRPEEKIAYSKIKLGHLSDSEAKRVAKAARDFRDMPVMLEQQPGLTVSEIGIRSKKYAQSLARQGKRIGLVIIDHMHIVKATSHYGGNRNNEITEISNGLKGLAKTLCVPVLALAQLNRAVEGRDDKRPTLADLRDSGSIEQDADLVMFAFREAYYLRDPINNNLEKEAQRIERLNEIGNRIELSVAKNRHGPQVTAPFFIDIAANYIRDLAPQDEFAGWLP